MLLRDAVRANTVPRLTSFQSDGAKERFVEALGHAAFDFIESRWGKAGIRQFLLALRRSASGGGDPYEAAFRMPAVDFERAFESYLRARLSDSGVAATPRELDARSTVQIEGLITATGVPAAAHLACIELLVTAASGAEQRWGIECGEARAEDVVSALKPGQRVVITGTPTICTRRAPPGDSLSRPAVGWIRVARPRVIVMPLCQPPVAADTHQPMLCRPEITEVPDLKNGGTEPTEGTEKTMTPASAYRGRWCRGPQGRGRWR